MGIKGTPPREVVIEISISRLRVWMAVFPVRSEDGEEVRGYVSLGWLGSIARRRRCWTWGSPCSYFTVRPIQ